MPLFCRDHTDRIGLTSVQEIEYIVKEHHVRDAFMGLILVPLVEKAAEHLTGKVPRVGISLDELRILKPSYR